MVYALAVSMSYNAELAQKLAKLWQHAPWCSHGSSWFGIALALVAEVFFHFAYHLFLCFISDGRALALAVWDSWALSRLSSRNFLEDGRCTSRMSATCWAAAPTVRGGGVLEACHWMQSNARVGRDSGWVFAIYPSSHQCLFDNTMVRDIWTCDGWQILGHSFLGRLRPPCDDCVLLELVPGYCGFQARHVHSARAIC